jgi:hypothetical protein
MDLKTLLGVLGEVPESERVRPILNHFPSLHTTVSGIFSAAGTLTETHLSCRDYGFEARLASSGKITTIYLMGSGNDGFAEFPYPLIEGLRFGAQRDAVESKFGKPHWSRTSNDTPIILDGAGDAIRYDLEDYVLYFQFNKRNGQLQQVAAESVIGWPVQQQ